jgi:DNA-directed RNA polymerase I, II, and III subunit RPABC2
MAESRDNKLNLKKIFMTSSIRTGTNTAQNTAQKTAQNTAQNTSQKTPQNIYLNQVSKSKSPNIQSGGKSRKDPNINSETADSDTESDSDSETADSDPSNLDSDPSDSESVISLDKVEDDEEVNVDVDEESEQSEEESKDDVVNSEYEEGPNDNTEKDTDKDTEINNEDDDCLYYDDDLVEERDSEIQVYEIPREERMTDPQLTHYEKVRILGIRAKQIAMGSKVMVKYDNSFGPVELAKYELQHKTTPLVIKRPLPDNTYEIWKVSDLNIDDDDSNIIKQDLENSFASIKKNDLYLIN